jgi:hypothetical protein
MSFKSETGLNERIQLSMLNIGSNFAAALKDFVS